MRTTSALNSGVTDRRARCVDGARAREQTALDARVAVPIDGLKRSPVLIAKGAHIMTGTDRHLPVPERRLLDILRTKSLGGARSAS